MLLLALFASVALAAFAAGPISPQYRDVKKTGIAAVLGNKVYDNCKFLTLPDDTVMQLFWSVNGDKVEIGLAMEFKVLQQGGWWAVGVSSSTGSQSRMANAEMVVGYIDRDNTGFGFLGALDSSGEVPPVFRSPNPNVTDSSIGVSQVVIGKDDLAIMEFTRPTADWAGPKSLIYSYRAQDNTLNAGDAPVPGGRLPSGKHTARDFVDFDFNVPSQQCEPPTPPDPNDPCSLLDAFSGVGHQEILAGSPVKIDWEVDCQRKEIEFTVEGEMTPGGWLAIGFNTASQMPGTDAYQMWVGADGSAKVQNGFSSAKNRPSSGQSVLIPNAAVSVVGNTHTFTFKRPIAPGEPGKDVDLAFGKKYFINVAKNDGSNDPDARHNVRQPGTKQVDFFEVEGNLPEPPAPTPPPVDGCGDLGKDFAVNSVLFESGAMLNMEIDCADESILFTLTAKSEGWIALGFSDAAQKMPGSDTYQLWISNTGEAKVRNGFATGRATPADDGLGNISDISGSERDGWVTVSFRRKFNTGDANDFVLSRGRPYFLNFASAPSNDPTTKHNFREWTETAIELFEDTGPVLGGPCLDKDSFTNSISLPLAGSDVRVDMIVNCRAAEIEFTLTGQTTGWLAFGFSEDRGMPNTDTLQVAFNNGNARVKDGFASSKSAPAEDEEFAAVRASNEDGQLSVTFVRKAYTGRKNDRVLFAGRPVYLHVAKSGNEAFTSIHSDRAPGAAPIELFEENEIEPIVPNPCENDAVSFKSYADIPMQSATDLLQIDWEIDCIARTIEFTVRGKAEGWLAIGFTDTPNKMSGADAYQMRNGDFVRNTFTLARSVVPDEVIDGSDVFLEDGVMEGTFKRDLAASRDQDVAFTQGKRWFINAAFRNDDNDWDKKHNFRTWSDDSFEFFEDRERPAPESSESEEPSEAPLDEGDVTVDLNGDDFLIEYVVDCEAEEIEFTVSVPYDEGWWAIGFNKEAKMAGTDTYQMRVKGGDAEIRNGQATSRSNPDEQEVFEADTFSQSGGETEIVFTRSFEGKGDDEDLSPGNEYFINVAYSSDDSWGNIHDKRASSKKKVDLLEGMCGSSGKTGATETEMESSAEGGSTDSSEGSNPCDEGEDDYKNTYFIELGDSILELEYEVDCKDEEIEFTIRGDQAGEDGWLAIGFSDDKESMKGTDTYQVRKNDDKWEVRNSWAEGLSLPESDDDEVDDDVDGEFDDGVMEVTFKRKWDTESDVDRALKAGEGWYINVAFASDNDWTKKHDGRNWSSERIDLFTDKAWPNPKDGGEGKPMVEADTGVVPALSLAAVALAAALN